MKKNLLFLLAIVLLVGTFLPEAKAQITVAGSTGADGTYTSLTNSTTGAFAAINATAQTGNSIVITITASSTGEDGAIPLNAGVWTSINIYPTVTGLEISGVAAKPLIDLNGADNVTLDGRVNQTGVADLIVSNTSPVPTAGTSTIRFINDASGNTVKYCYIKGSSSDASGGIVFISTTTGTTGNDNNTITYNNITNAGVNRPVNVIFSNGTAAKENSGDIISNNNIYDFLNRNNASFGIQLINNTYNCSISGNSFYETDAFVPTASAAYNVISIGAQTLNISVSGNYIGGSSPNCGSLGVVPSWTKTNAFNNAFIAINLANANSCSVQGNTIQNFSYSNSGAANWTGIAVNTSSSAIGTISPNTIGASTGTGSITFTGGATGATFYGISIASTGNVSAENNLIGSITVSNAATMATNFYGISNNGSGANSISNNTIGSLTTANSINASSASTANAQSVYGINSAAGNATISGNTIANLINGTTNATAATTGVINGILIAGGSNAVNYNTVRDLSIANFNDASTQLASVGGIVVNTLSLTQTILGNTIFNLSNTETSFAGSVVGIYFSGSTTANTVSENFIHSLTAPGLTSAANIYGIKINAGATTYSNNIINVGDNSAATVFGIYETGAVSNNCNLYFNTVYVGGVPTSGAFPSYALYSASTLNTRNFRNNILSNARSNSGATGTHYAVSLASITGLTIDYNDYFTSGTGSIFGYLGADVTTFGAWQIATAQDVASLNIDPLFASAGGVLPANYVPAASLPAVSGTGILVDFNESVRNASPVMGAIESAVAGNLVDVYVGATLQASYPTIQKAFSAINAGTLTGNLIVEINGNQYLTSPAILKASGTGLANYTSVLVYPTVTGLSILGDMASPLIDLDGADQVTIDGRVYATGTTKDLIINNSNISAAPNTSTIRFINDASNNIIQYCVIKGAETNANSGIVFFSTTNGAAGNDGNLIENNDITSSTDVTRPLNAIYSEGQATVGLENSGNTINANKIYDFLNRGIASSGIHIFARSTNWTLSGNSFYETTTFTPTVAVASYNIINIRVSGTFNINNNTIGGSASDNSGTWTKTGGNLFGNNIFYAIAYNPALNSSTFPSICNIQGNTIKNFNYSNFGTAAWYGIWIAGASNVTGSLLNIGTTTPNTIGAATGNGSIVYTGGATGANFYGINIATTATYYYLTTNIQNNIIGSITVANSAVTPGATNFFGISKTVGASLIPEVNNITNNTIGSTDPVTTNSIQATSVSGVAAQTVYGVYSIANNPHTTYISGNTIANLTNAGTSTTSAVNGITVSSSALSPAATYTGGINFVTGNTIRDLTAFAANITSANLPSVSGISLGIRATSTNAQTISGNKIYNLSSQHPTAAVSILGIYFGGATVISDISSNFIHSFTINPSNSTGANLYGIRGAAGIATYANNIVSLKSDLPATIYGMYIAPSTAAHNLYFNTVYIGGTVSSGALTSYAYIGIGAGIRNFKNNIFNNTRSNTGATGKHYGAYFFTTTGTITCDYNDYLASGTGGVLGAFGATETSTLPIVTGQDVHSLSVSPNFAIPGGTAALNYTPSANLPAALGTGITTDYSAVTRSLTTPMMGAFEYTPCVNPTDGGIIAADQNICLPLNPAPLTSTGPATGHIGTLEYQWQNSTDNIVFADIAGANAEIYTPTTIGVTTWYKRLARVSCKADWTTATPSNIVTLTVIVAPTTAVAGANQTQFNNGSFTLAGNTPSVGTGTWAIVNGTATINNPSSPTSAVTAVPAGTSVELSWTITNGICSSTSNVILTNTALTGILKVGPTGTFPSITNALAFIVANGGVGAGGAILELQPTYLSNVETFPIIFTSTLNTSLANPLSVRPDALATGMIITNGGIAAHTIYLNGANYVTFDGRPGGAGSALELTITNDLPNSYLYNAIRVKSSSNNAFLYCHISNSNAAQTSSPWTPGALAWFEYDANGLLQNYNNTIDHCSIHGVSNSAAGLASNLVNLLGSPASTITNNNFYDFGTKGNATSYALTVGSSNGTVISGNSFYQTAAQTITYGSSVIILNGGGDYTVTGNYIGGSAPLCAGGPTIMTLNSSASATYTPFVIATGNTLLTSIQGNTIQNIQATFLQSGYITFFSQSMGKVDIGTVTPNIIGSETDPNSITVVSNPGTGGVVGFACSSGSTIDFTNFSNNIISGISLTTVTGNGISFSGINASAFNTAELILTNNTIGSTTLANSINNATPGLTVGINASGRNLNTITGNTVANLTQSNTGAANNQLIGIRAEANPGLFHISGNTVKNLNSASTSAGTGMNAGVVGIYAGSYNTAGQIISGNIIHSLANTSASSSPAVTGIYYQGPGGANSISGNFIHSLNLASVSTTASLTGIYADASQWNSGSVASFSNNMISLGIDASGAGLITGYSIKGIYDGKGSNSFYNNSVYIGGTGVTGITSNTYAYSSDVITNIRAVQNNILVNNRSGGTVGQHYAVAHAGITLSPAGLTSSHNLYFTSGTNGMLGHYNGADQATLTAWQAATGLDNGSVNAYPSYVNPVGDATTVDLHITNPTPVEGTGTFIASVTTDFDGQLRSDLTPNDIGADAGIFISTADLTAPSITFTPIANTLSTANLALTAFATITDNVGVSTGANSPRIYYKKLTDANVFAGNTSAANGWKYTSAANATSPYDFTIDYSIINGGFVNLGEVIQYFVVAQDDANNMSSSYTGATSASATDPIQSINSAPPIASINAYQIINNQISGTITVPGNYATLTGPGGLFQAINEGNVTGNISVLITDNLVEPGTFALNQFAAPFTLNIAPASASLKTITANIDNGLIRFFGADNVTIDGRFAGSGKYLEFYNEGYTSYLACTFLFTNAANNNTIRYVAVKGHNPSGTIIYFRGIYPNTGNSSHNTIDFCDISSPGSVGVGSMISSYSNEGGPNTFNTISNCNIFDFYHPTNPVNAINLGYGSSDWTITGNSFYQTGTTTTTGGVNVIMITNGTNHLISNNYIGGSAPLAAGAPWTATIGNYFRTIYCFSNDGLYNINITGNTITNMNLTSTNTTNGWYGIDVSSGIGAVTGNTIGSIAANNAIVFNGYTFTGIQKIGSATMDINNNNIGGITTTSGFYGINSSGAATNTNGNVIGSTTMANSINVAAGNVTGISGMHSAASSCSDNTIANLTSGTGNVKGVIIATTTLNTYTVYTIERNIIRNLTSGSIVAGTGNVSSVLGMAYSANGVGSSISQNQIYDLANTATTGNASVTGLYLSSTSGTVNVKRNTLYGYTLANADITASITGIHINGYYNGVYVSYITANVQNNLVQLGEGVITGYEINGILDVNGTTNLFFNTIVLSGALTDNTVDTYALNSTNTNTRDYRNNIFANNRSGGIMGSGNHNVIKVAGTVAGQSGLTLDYNDYYAGMSLTEFTGFFNGSFVPNFADWKTAVGKDVHSVNGDPLFTSPTNLIPLAGSPVIGTGTPTAIAGITLDYAGTTRLLPNTMGAYESGICINPTAGGTIATDQNGCSPFDPALITSSGAPTGNTGTPEYKWQQSTTSAITGFTDIATTNSDSYDPGSITQTTWFKRLVRVACKNEWTGAVESNVVIMTVNPVLNVSLTIAATATTTCAGISVTFTATAINPGTSPVYQWKRNGVNVGTNSTTFSYVPTNGNIITCVLTSNATPCAQGSPATSNAITMVVNPLTQATVNIFDLTGNPVCAGTSKLFFANIANGGTTPLYQWKVNGIITGPNANNFTYIPVNNDVVTCTLYSSAVCPGVSPAVSNAITNVVNPTDVSVSITPDLNNVCDGTTVTFTAVPVNGGTSPTYQWYNGVNTVGTGLITYSYIPVNGDEISVVYTANLACANGATATSNVVPMTVNPILTAGVSIAADATNVCTGTTVTFTATPTNGGTTPVYQWYNGATPVGTDSPAFAYIPVNGEAISVVMTSNATPCLNGSPATSNILVITVNPILTASVSIVADVNPVCAGSTVTFTATPVNGGTTPSYQWYNGAAAVGTNSPSYAYVPVNGDAISVVMTSNATPCLTGSPATSNTVVITLIPLIPVSVTMAADANNVCAGTIVNYTATPTNGGANPAYQWYSGATPVGTGLATLSYAPANGDAISVVMTSNLNGCLSGSPATSNIVPMVVNPLLNAAVTIAASATNVATGTTVTFTATPTNGGTTPVYQWYMGASPVGTNSPTYAYVAVNGDAISVVMTSNATPCLTGSPATSNTITMNVETLPAGLVSYWKLNEATGNTYVDFKGINNGTGNLSPTAVTGIANGAQQFNGTTTKISVPANPTFDFAANGDFSVECWYKGAAAPTSTQVIASRYISGIYWYVGIMSSGRVGFSMSGGGVYINVLGSVITDGQWHHITATRNGTTGESKMYVDGSLKNTTVAPFNVALSSATSKLEIGSLSGVMYFLQGSLDELAIHNVALTPAEIQRHFNIGWLHGLGYYSNLAPAITTIAPLNAKVGQLYSYDVNADGYPAPTFSLTTSPAGMTIDPNTGLIQWTPASIGNVNVTVEAHNGVNPVSTQSFILSPTVPAGLVAYWHLDEAVGNTYLDFTGINNGTGNLSPTALPGIVNGAQQFNGTTTKIGVPANPTFDFAANGDFSVECWYKGAAAPTSTQVIASRYISGIYWYVGVMSSGRVGFSISGGGVYINVQGSVITNGQWHHITATRNGTTGESKMYVDGSLQNTTVTPFNVALSSATSKLEIGSLSGVMYFLQGSLDELAIHNVTLTPAEIQRHYNSGSLYGLGYYSYMPPAITTIAPLNASLGQLYNYDVNADGYPVPTYTLTTAPAGMTINATTGVINWTPVAIGPFTVAVQATNGIIPASVQTFTIVVTNPVVVPPGLVAYWKLDEAAGNTYLDYTGVNNGTGNPSPVAVPGKVNRAQLFDGTTTKIGAPANPTFDFAANGDFSVECWYKGAAAPISTQVIASRYISGIYWYVGVMSSGRVGFSMSGGGVYINVLGSVITDGQWHHITATRNGTTGESKMYVDGSLKNTTVAPFNVALSSATSKLEIGSLSGMMYFLQGSLDEVAIYNIALTPAQITQHYNNGLLGSGYYSIAPAIVAAPVKTGEDINTLGDGVNTGDELRAYAYYNQEIRIVGNVKGGSLAALYDLQGRNIEAKVLEEGDLNVIPTPGIKTGIYILRINDHGNNQTFKIFVRE